MSVKLKSILTVIGTSMILAGAIVADLTSMRFFAFALACVGFGIVVQCNSKSN